MMYTEEPTSNNKKQQEEEKPKHKKYLNGFRTEQCKLFLEQQCQHHRPYTCFNWHFPNQKRRKPVKRADGTFNYNSDVYCDKFDEDVGTCPNGEECPYAHRNAGDTEKRYHPRYFKTGNCIYETTESGTCVKNGPHCAFAHGLNDIRQPVYDIREVHDSISKLYINLPACLEKERVLSEDPKWKDMFHVLAFYKTELCKKPPRMCRQGYSCPFFHNGKDKRRSPETFRYKSTPCPSVRPGDEWLDSSLCENGDDCQYCHTRTEQQFHPEIYNSSKCNDVINSGYCPRGSFCAFAHLDSEMNVGREFMLSNQLKSNQMSNCIISYQWMQQQNTSSPTFSNVPKGIQEFEINKSLEYLHKRNLPESGKIEEDYVLYRNNQPCPSRPNTIIGKSLSQNQNPFEQIVTSTLSPVIMKNRQWPGINSIPNRPNSTYEPNSFIKTTPSPMNPIVSNNCLSKQNPVKNNYKNSMINNRNYSSNHKINEDVATRQKNALRNYDINPLTIGVDLNQQASESSSGSLSYSTSPWSNQFSQIPSGSSKQGKSSLINLINNCLISNNLETIKTNLVDAYIGLVRNIPNPSQDSYEMRESSNNIDDIINVSNFSLKSPIDISLNKNPYHSTMDSLYNPTQNFSGKNECLANLSGNFGEIIKRLEQKNVECEELKKERDAAIIKLRQSMVLIRHLLNENENFRLSSTDHLENPSSIKRPLFDQLKDKDILDMLTPESFTESSLDQNAPTHFPPESLEGKVNSLWNEELSPRQMAFMVNTPWNHNVTSNPGTVVQENNYCMKFGGLENFKSSGESLYCIENESKEKSESEKLLEQRYILSGRPSSLLQNDSGVDFSPNLDIANLLNTKD